MQNKSVRAIWERISVYAARSYQCIYVLRVGRWLAQTNMHSHKLTVHGSVHSKSRSIEILTHFKNQPVDIIEQSFKQMYMKKAFFGTRKILENESKRFIIFKSSNPECHGSCTPIETVADFLLIETKVTEPII